MLQKKVREMSDALALTIPMDRVARIAVHINSPRKTLDAIKKSTGADYILNGTLYNMRTGAVNCHLRVDGRTVKDPGYHVYGYAWDVGPDIRMEDLHGSRARNYIGCTPLVKDGKAIPNLTYAPGQSGRRGRSAIGIKKGRLALYCSRDGGSMRRTPEQLRDDLVSAGWDSAVMLDSGGSSQCDFDGKRINSARRVQHLILVYLRKGDGLEPEGEKPMVEINAYSKEEDGGKKLSTNFTVREFACKDGSDAVLVAPRLVMVLQSIRSHFAAPVVIHSAYRTPQYNAKVGGVAHSQHCYGTAADISVRGHSPAEVAAYARQLMPDWGGVGIYTKNGFTHIDVREKKSDWTG